MTEEKKEEKNLDEQYIEDLDSLGIKKNAKDVGKIIWSDIINCCKAPVGYAKKLFKKKNKEENKKDKDPSVYSIIKDTVKEDKDLKSKLKRQFFIESTLGVVRASYSLIQGKFTNAIEVALKTGNMGNAFIWMGINTLRGNVFEALWNHCATKREDIKTHIDVKERKKLNKYVVKLPQKFLQYIGYKEISGKVTQASSHKSAMISNCLNASSFFIGSVASLGVLAYNSLPLTGIALAGVSALCYADSVIRRSQRKHRSTQRNYANKYNARLMDHTDNAKIINKMNAVEKSQEIIDTESKKNIKIHKKSTKLFNLFALVKDASFNTIMGLGVAGFALYAGMKTGDIGTVMMLTSAGGIAMGGAYNFINFCNKIKQDKQSYLDTIKEMKCPENLRPKSGDKSFDNENSRVEIKHVYYTYDSDRNDKQQDGKTVTKKFEGLKNINTYFDKGSLDVIIGASGHGKSTLLNMICHIDDVKSGEITIGGVNVNDVSQEEMVRYVSQMEQDSTFLSTSSMRENLELACKEEDPEKKKEKIDKALEFAGLKDVYYSKDKNGELACDVVGRDFSGGQKQRFAIARALLTGRKVLIFDEPTAALDSETNMDLIAKFKVLAKQYNVILVTHNKDIVANSDRCIMIENGEIVADGNINQLINNNDYIKRSYSKYEILDAKKRYIDANERGFYTNIEQQLNDENIISSRYNQIKSDFEKSPKKAINEIRDLLKAIHSQDCNDQDVAVAKKILSEGKSEISDVYVNISKQIIKDKRYSSK